MGQLKPCNRLHRAQVKLPDALAEDGVLRIMPRTRITVLRLLVDARPWSAVRGVGSAIRVALLPRERLGFLGHVSEGLQFLQAVLH